MARATLGNERVSIGGGSGSAGVNPSVLFALVGEHADRLAGAKIRVGNFLSDEHALRLLNLRRAVRSIEGGEPGPGGQHHQTQARRAHGRVRRDLVRAARPGHRPAGRSRGDRRPRWPWVRARMAIAGGTSEVTRNQIAERILGMPRDPLIK